MTQIFLCLFGAPRLECEGALVAVNARKALALLAYLAATGREHSREVLLTLLWPDLSPNKARAALRNALWMLNKTPVSERLVVDRETVTLTPDADFVVDTVRFRKLSAQGLSMTDCEAALAPLDEAATLYRDDFLAGFTLPDSPDFDEWQYFEAEGLRRELATVLERLVDCRKARGDFDAAIEYARRLLALDQLHEPVHRLLIELYAQSGQRSAAMRQYEYCARVLDEELGVPPDPETTVLYEHVHARQATPAAPPPASTAPPHNLPAQLTPFVGREAELAELTALLTGGEVRLITILGPGGMGKTRLAQELARAQLDLFADGVFFVGLARLDRAEAIIPTIAEALNFTFYDSGTPEQQLLDYLCGKRMLLILDNCEHLPDGMDLAADILRAAPAVQIIATSRERLNLGCEQLFRIDGIAFPDWETPEDALEYSAVRLFLQSARRVLPDFELNGDDLTDVARICRLVQGMPLGILLAAAWVEVLMLPKIVAEIARSPDILEGDWRDLPDRHQSMRAVFDHSWRLLSETERAAFQRLSVFRGGCTRTAAQKVTGVSLRLLMSLVNKSLLHRTASERFEVHELLRQYAVEKLAEAQTEYETARDRHSVFYCDFVSRQAAELKGEHQKRALRAIEGELENAETAWAWAVKRGRIDRLDQELEGLCRFYVWRRREQALETLCRQASETLLPVTTSGDGLRVLAQILAWQGCLLPDDPDRELVQMSLDLLDKAAESGQVVRAELAFSQLRLGEVTSDRDESLRLYRRSLDSYQALGDRWGEAEALERIAWRLSKESGFAEAEQLAGQSMSIRQDLGDRQGIARSLAQVAEFAWQQGKFEESERLDEQSLALSRELEDQFAIARMLSDLGAVKSAIGKFIEAQMLTRESLGIHQRLGNKIGVAFTIHILGWLLMTCGQYGHARQETETALSIYQKLNYQGGAALCQENLGKIILIDKKYDEGLALIRESLAAFREDGNQLMIGFNLTSLTCAERMAGNLPEAHQYLIEGLKLVSGMGAFLPLLDTLAVASLLLADFDQPELAVEIYALASSYPFIGNSQWNADVIGREIEKVAAELPSDVVTAAKDRGRARDLWETASEILEEMETM